MIRAGVDPGKEGLRQEYIERGREGEGNDDASEMCFA